MNFIINFSAEYCYNIFNIEQCNHGTALLELAYSRIGRFDQRLLKAPSITKKYFKVEIPYEMAISSGHFENVAAVNVVLSHISSAEFNKFLKIEFSEERSLDTQEILSVIANYVVDEELVLRQWQNAGFPISWVVAIKNL